MPPLRFPASSIPALFDSDSVFSSGSDVIDQTLLPTLGGGFPYGSIVELAGPPSSGKSTLAEDLMFHFLVSHFRAYLTAGQSASFSSSPKEHEPTKNSTARLPVVLMLSTNSIATSFPFLTLLDNMVEALDDVWHLDGATVVGPPQEEPDRDNGQQGIQHEVVSRLTPPNTISTVHRDDAAPCSSSPFQRGRRSSSRHRSTSLAGPTTESDDCNNTGGGNTSEATMATPAATQLDDGDPVSRSREPLQGLPTVAHRTVFALLEESLLLMDVHSVNDVLVALEALHDETLWRCQQQQQQQQQRPLAPIDVLIVLDSLVPLLWSPELDMGGAKEVAPLIRDVLLFPNGFEHIHHHQQQQLQQNDSTTTTTTASSTTSLVGVEPTTTRVEERLEEDEEVEVANRTARQRLRDAMFGGVSSSTGGGPGMNGSGNTGSGGVFSLLKSPYLQTVQQLGWALRRAASVQYVTGSADAAAPSSAPGGIDGETAGDGGAFRVPRSNLHEALRAVLSRRQQQPPESTLSHSQQQPLHRCGVVVLNGLLSSSLNNSRSASSSSSTLLPPKSFGGAAWNAVSDITLHFEVMRSERKSNNGNKRGREELDDDEEQRREGGEGREPTFAEEVRIRATLVEGGPRTSCFL